MGARPGLIVIVAVVVVGIGAGIVALTDRQPTSTPTPTQAAVRTPARSPLPPTPTASPSPTTTPPSAPLDLANLEWQTLTEPFGGDDARDMDGVLLDATGRVVVWGSRLVEGLSGAFADAYLAACGLTLGTPLVASLDRDLDAVQGLRRISG